MEGWKKESDTHTHTNHALPPLTPPQAASGTKGGSSGSPVVDASGRAVALNAGGKVKAASAYYLPLHRVVRALDALRAGYDAAGGTWVGAKLTVPRGDLQAVFQFKGECVFGGGGAAAGAASGGGGVWEGNGKKRSLKKNTSLSPPTPTQPSGFDEARRLGLHIDAEAALRAAAAGPGGGGAAADAASCGTGALVVVDVIPSAVAGGALEPGDVLLSVDGAEIVHFLPLEAALDGAVGRSVRVVVDRGGERIEVDLAVQDLHTVTPSSCLEVAGGILHPLSYQVARSHRSPTGLLYVADPGHTLGWAGVPRGAVVTALPHRRWRTRPPPPPPRLRRCWRPRRPGHACRSTGTSFWTGGGHAWGWPRWTRGGLAPPCFGSATQWRVAPGARCRRRRPVWAVE